MRIPFGRHKGKPLSDVPTDYLQWVYLSAKGATPFLKEAIKEELDRRFGRERRSDSHNSSNGTHHERARREQSNGSAVKGVKSGIDSIYRRLVMENHPDRGGDTRAMAAINAFYERLQTLLESMG